VKIRSAQAGDVPKLVELHMRAFTGHRAVKFGARYVEATHNWFIGADDSISIVARGEDGIVGFVEGAAAGYAARMAGSVWLEGIRAVLKRPWLLADGNVRYAIMARLKWLLRGSQGGPQSTHVEAFHLVSIAVDPDCRGRGIAGFLMAEFEKRVLRSGYSRMRLSVYRSNESAVRAYRKAGWKQYPVEDPYSD
jgi:ribosomal protein S18 acetylase RimI-like enzyme